VIHVDGFRELRDEVLGTAPRVDVPVGDRDIELPELDSLVAGRRIHTDAKGGSSKKCVVIPVPDPVDVSGSDCSGEQKQ